MKILKKIIVKLNLINILSIPMYICRIFKINNKKIVFVNFSGKGFGDSPKYICNELLKNNDGYDIIWVVKNKKNENFPHKIRTVKIYSLKYFYDLATAKVWVNNSRFPLFVKKRKNQYYIQTWHGGLALKKIEYDAEEKLSEYYKKVMKKDNRQIDLMVSNSSFCTKMYRNGFKYYGEILECGSPRNDILINAKKSISEKVKQKYNIKNEKIILYAPTFRKDYSKNPYDIDFINLEKKLKIKTNKKWKILIKLHPRIADISQKFITANNVINASEYDDIQELIIACDLLITDYSSTMFEAMIANKPVILYANDISDYNEERGMYFNFNELPFPLSENNKELDSIIENFNEKEIDDNYLLFKEKIGLHENGHASEEVCKRILEIIK